MTLSLVAVPPTTAHHPCDPAGTICVVTWWGDTAFVGEYTIEGPQLHLQDPVLWIHTFLLTVYHPLTGNPILQEPYECLAADAQGSTCLGQYSSTDVLLYADEDTEDIARVKIVLTEFNIGYCASSGGHHCGSEPVPLLETYVVDILD